MYRAPLIVLLALAAFAASLEAQAQPAAGAGADDATLDALAKEAAEARDASLSSALAALEKASASSKAAEAYFYDCVKNFDFKRDLEVGSKFDEWRRAFAEQWRGHDLGFVLQLQLRYQALVLRSARSTDKEKEAMTTLWLSFAETIVSHADDAMFGASFLAQPINTSVFDKALKLRQLASGAESFGGGPLDVGGMFDRYIHPHVGAESRRSAWDRRITLQTDFAKKTLLATEDEDFERFDIPRLRWRQLVDVRFHGGTPADPAAWTEATTFIRQQIKHPDAGLWIDVLKALRKKDSAPAKPE